MPSRYKFWTPSGNFQINLIVKTFVSEPVLEPKQKLHKNYLGMRFTNEAKVTIVF